MKTLTGLSSKWGFLDKERWCLFGTQRPEICFLGLPSARHNGKFGFLSSVEENTIRPIFAAVSPLSSSASNSQSEFQTEETESPDGLKTARVKFQLQRQCLFGQQFFVVGDDPVLGSWNPSNAVPLTWSDGHIWTVEIDIPCGKAIGYKFIVKGAANTILWQPGPDRILNAWETSNIITVCDDWDNVHLQKIMEENLAQERIDSNDSESVGVVAENITGAEEGISASHAYEVVGIDAELISGAEEGIDVEETVTPGPSDFGNNGSTVHVENLSSKDEASLALDEVVPVLVPGLHTILSMETEVRPSNEIQMETVAEELKLRECSELNSNEEFPADSSLDKGTSEMEDNGHDQEPELEEYHWNTHQLEPRVIETEMQWGRRTIKKLLTDLGWL